MLPIRLQRIVTHSDSQEMYFMGTNKVYLEVGSVQ